MAPGRNAPCPCGSGQKYKHCCLAARTAADDERAMPWRRVRRALEGFTRRQPDFVHDVYGPGVALEAWAEFNLGREAPWEADNPHMPVFCSWVFYHWAPDPNGTRVADERLHDVTPAHALLEREGLQLDPLLAEYVESVGSFPPSFYEVTASPPGLLGLRDVFTGEEFEVHERLASEDLQAGELLYATLAQAAGVTLLDIAGPVAFSPMVKVELIELRRRMRRGRRALSREDLRDWDCELRDAYLHITDRLLNPPLPRLHTTDGEEVVHQKLVFDIDSPEEAFDALRRLDCDAGAEGAPNDATRDAQGRLVSARIVWTRPEGKKRKGRTTRTVLGEIRIHGQRMTAEVSSNGRAELLRAIVAKALGAKARYRMADVQSVEKMLVSARERAATEPALDDDAAQTPEFKAFVAEYTARFYDDWPTQQIPMLGGRTPLQAVKTRDGREMVEALVLDIERRPGLPGPAPDREVIRKLRRRLGLTEQQS
jgi:hypothetical protein